MDLHTQTWGEPNDLDPILLLHDSLGCIGTWRDFPQELAQRTGRRVIAYDRLGFGQSPARSDLPTLGFVEEEGGWVVRVLDAFEIPSAVLFGYSVGGSMALACAARYPSRVSSVISMSTIAFMEDRTLEGLELATRLFRSPASIEKLRRWHGEKAEWVVSAWLDVWTAPEFLDWSLAPVLPLVQCPVLVLHGDRDEYGSVAFPELIASLVSGPSRMVIFEDCGHAPHREMPEQVIAKLVTQVSPVGTDS